jgi:hypothetical protein
MCHTRHDHSHCRHCCYKKFKISLSDSPFCLSSVFFFLSIVLLRGGLIFGGNKRKRQDVARDFYCKKGNWIAFPRNISLPDAFPDSQAATAVRCCASLDWIPILLDDSLAFAAGISQTPSADTSSARNECQCMHLPQCLFLGGRSKTVMGMPSVLQSLRASIDLALPLPGRAHS